MVSTILLPPVTVANLANELEKNYGTNKNILILSAPELQKLEDAVFTKLKKLNYRPHVISLDQTNREKITYEDFFALADKQNIAGLISLTGFLGNAPTPDTQPLSYLNDIIKINFYFARLAANIANSIAKPDQHKFFIAACPPTPSCQPKIKETITSSVLSTANSLPQTNAGTIAARCYSAGIGGIIKCLAKEEQSLNCKFIRCDNTSDDNIAQAILEESISNDNFVSIVRQANERYADLPMPAAFLNRNNRQIQLQKQDLILVTGGARGVTAAAVQTIAAHLPARFILAGRTDLSSINLQGFSEHDDDKTIKNRLVSLWKQENRKFNPKELDTTAKKIAAGLEVKKHLDSLKAMGREAHYVSLDISNAEQTASTIREIQSKHGHITGFIHGAGVIQDKYLKDKTWEQFSLVCRTKLDGFFHVFSHLNPEDLKLVCFFSSVAGRFGNTGQSDYACANEILNAIAAFNQQHLPHCRFISMCWGPFAGGMVNAELARLFTSQGIELIPLEGGAKQVLGELLFSGNTTTETVIGVGDPELGARSGAVPPTQWQFSRQIIPADYQWLLDHRLKEAPVLPMAFAMEWAAQAAKQIFPQLHLHKISNFKVNNGISFDQALKNPQQAEQINFFIQKAAVQPANGVELNVEIRLANAKSPLPNYQAQVLLLSELAPAAAMPTPAMPSGTALKTSIDELYYNYLFHGKSLRCISKIDFCSEKAISAFLKSQPPTNIEKQPVFANWQTEPVILDGMAQLSLIWLGINKNQIGIPQQLKNYTQYQHFTTIQNPDNLRCLIELDDINDTTHQVKANFYIYEKETIIAAGQGWEAVFNESFNQYTTRWKEKNAK